MTRLKPILFGAVLAIALPSCFQSAEAPEVDGNGTPLIDSIKTELSFPPEFFEFELDDTLPENSIEPEAKKEVGGSSAWYDFLIFWE